MSNQIDASELEDLYYDIEGIAQILLSLVIQERGMDHDSKIYRFLGSRLNDYCLELHELIYPPKEPRLAVAVDPFTNSILHTAIERLEADDLPGVIRCASQAIEQIKNLMPAEPAEAAQ